MDQDDAPPSTVSRHTLCDCSGKQLFDLVPSLNCRAPFLYIFDPGAGAAGRLYGLLMLKPQLVGGTLQPPVESIQGRVSFRAVSFACTPLALSSPRFLETWCEEKARQLET